MPTHGDFTGKLPRDLDVSCVRLMRHVHEGRGIARSPREAGVRGRILLARITGDGKHPFHEPPRRYQEISTRYRRSRLTLPSAPTSREHPPSPHEPSPTTLYPLPPETQQYVPHALRRCILFPSSSQTPVTQSHATDSSGRAHAICCRTRVGSSRFRGRRP